MDAVHSVELPVRVHAGGYRGFNERGLCRPTISSDDRVKYGRSRSHVHQQQKANEEAWLDLTLSEIAYDRTKFTHRSLWRRHLYQIDDGQRAIPAWLYHHPEDIGSEWSFHYKRVRKNPWHTRPQRITFDEKIFDRDRPLHAALDRPVSPKGHEMSVDEPPLPWGATSWEEVQGEASAKRSKKQEVARAVKCIASRLAHNVAALHIRSVVGYVVDARKMKWPVRYRFAKAGDQWTCQ